MEKALWIVGGMAGGVALGVVTYLWDALDGNVNFVMGWIHEKALTWGMLLLSLEVLAWAFEVVPGWLVIGGLLGLVAQVITALVMSLAAPLVKAILPPPKKVP